MVERRIRGVARWSGELDGIPIADARDLQRLMVGDVIGGTVSALVWRDGELRTIIVHPVELTPA